MSYKELVELPDVKLYAKSSDFMAGRMKRDTHGSIVLNKIIEHVIEKFGSILYIEVGCNYGLELIRSTKLIKSLTNNYKIIAFEPGESSEYLIDNLEINGLANDVDFQAKAISNSIGIADLYGEDGHSENNRLVNCVPESHIVGQVETTTLDAVLSAEDSSIPIVIKIDTQGAEYEVFQGGIETLKKRQSFIISEFTPWALSSRIAPQIFLEELSQKFEIYDLGYKRDKCYSVDNYDEFSLQINGEFPSWTDVLMLNKINVEFNTGLLDNIKKAINDNN